MASNTEEVVNEIICKSAGLKLDEIFPDARLEQDCGITGDDAWELLEAIHKQLGTDFSELEFSLHFWQEGDGLLSAIFNRDRERHRQAFPVTVKHLYKVVEEGHWSMPPQVKKV